MAFDACVRPPCGAVPLGPAPTEVEVVDVDGGAAEVGVVGNTCLVVVAAPAGASVDVVRDPVVVAGTSTVGAAVLAGAGVRVCEGVVGAMVETMGERVVALCVLVCACAVDPVLVGTWDETEVDVVPVLAIPGAAEVTGLDAAAVVLVPVSPSAGRSSWCGPLPGANVAGEEGRKS